MTIRDLFQRTKGGASQAVTQIGEWLPTIPELKLFKTHDFPIYMIHKGGNADDYYFVFDFETFDENSRESTFSRPSFNILCGRDDFDRASFA